MALTGRCGSLSLPGLGVKIAKREDFILRENGFSWRGNLENRFESVIITASESRLYSTIITNTDKYVVLPSADGHILSIPSDTGATCGADFRIPNALPVTLGRVTNNPKIISGDPSIIDVAYLLSNQACQRILDQFPLDCQDILSQPNGALLVNEEIRLFAQSRIDLVNTALQIAG